MIRPSNGIFGFLEIVSKQSKSTKYLCIKIELSGYKVAYYKLVINRRQNGEQFCYVF